MAAAEHEPEPDVEVVDALPVPAGVPGPVTGSREAQVPVVRQAAAVAATSFLAGAATIAVARVLRAGGRRRRRRPRRAAGHVVVTRSFLVDVHVLSGRE